MDQSPLGREADYPDQYDADLLFPIPRADNREALGIRGELPFSGYDLWNAWELTWLQPNGLPVVATAAITVPASSTNIIESKSLKLYLNSFAMTRFADATEVNARIERDLGACCGAEVEVDVVVASDSDSATVARLPGLLLDRLAVNDATYAVDAGLLTADSAREVREDLHSHLLRSLCPVTGQPDLGSVLISYAGPAIDHAGLLRYLVSFRQHQDYHESCVERIFLDITARCQPSELTVMARYQRRGGIDINPVRSSHAAAAINPRLWRQ